ncbi:hypothetical protein D3C73_1563530 [compost metagenome]
MSVGEVIQVAQQVLLNNVEEVLIPFRIQRMQGVLVFDKTLSRDNHSLSAGAALVFWQIAATAHESISHPGIDFGKLWNWRLV